MIPLSWYVPAGLFETLYYAVVLWICWRFNHDLHSNPFEKFSKEIIKRFHKGGSLGRTLLLVKDIMVT